MRGNVEHHVTFVRLKSLIFVQHDIQHGVHLKTAEYVTLIYLFDSNSSFCVIFPKGTTQQINVLDAFQVFGLFAFQLWRFLLFFRFLKEFPGKFPMKIQQTKIFSNKLIWPIAGPTEVAWRPGQETSLAPPYSNLRIFGSKSNYLRHCWHF